MAIESQGIEIETRPSARWIEAATDGLTAAILTLRPQPQTSAGNGCTALRIGRRPPTFRVRIF